MTAVDTHARLEACQDRVGRNTAALAVGEVVARRFKWSRFAQELHDLAADLHGGSPPEEETAVVKRAA